MLKKVVLPAPFGPISETIEPCGIVKSMSFVATRPPNSLRTCSATRRSVIFGIAVGERALERDVVERCVVDAELELALVSPLGDQALGPEEHHHHDDHPVEPELVLRRVEVDPAFLELGAEGRKAGNVEIAEDHAA